MRKIKFNEVFVPKYRSYLIIIFVILSVLCIAKPNPVVILASILTYIFVLFYTFKKRKGRIDRIVKNINSFMLKLNTDDSILNFPLPAVIVTDSGNILWNNKGFEDLFKGINKEKYVENIIKELDEDFDENFASIDKELSIHDKHYRLLGNLVNIRKRGVTERNLMLYFIDRSDYYKLFRAYEDSKDCVGLILVDNYDEVVQGVADNEKAQLVASVETHLREWYSFTGGIFIKLDRNKFLVVFERKHLKALTETKFDVLDSIKNITFSNKMPVTLSIAIVLDETSMADKLHNAFSTIDIALGRGGDQAIIKKESKYEFFGGKTKELEKRTRVKARVIAQALQELISESKNVIIMGHKNMDADCLGSALGVHRIAKSLGKDAYILFNNQGIALSGLLSRLSKEKSYDDVLLGTNEILTKFGPDTLLVVVDTHKNDYVESQEVLEKASKIVLIDHHRRSADFISDPTLTFHEVYASSACELVTEIIQYIDAKVEIPMVEAEAMYAGILTDTKNFTFKTGVRTFEAAAYLKKLGVDVVAVKKLFDNDIDTYVAIADVIRNSETINTNIAIALCPPNIENAMQIAAQSADELISLNGIETSFVLVDMGEFINISGRSNGGMNVQVVLEKLGGGGHQTVAGAQVYGKNIEETKAMLIEAINQTEVVKE
ncbi:MAG: DHH family phosphoesterase [Clostridia bacterium]|nr:DHH family phosphoesterase [Clostridia bacterium]